jgi:Zn-dependent oligopeptidase
MPIARAAVALLAVLAVAPTLAQRSNDVTDSSSAPFYVGVTDDASLARIAERHFANADALVESILSVRGQPTVSNTLVPYDRLAAELESVETLGTVVARLHPVEQMRTAGERLAQRAAARGEELSLRPELYRALAGMSLVGAEPAAKRLAQREIRNFTLAGVNAPEETRARLQQLRNDLVVAEQGVRSQYPQWPAHHYRRTKPARRTSVRLHRCSYECHRHHLVEHG